MANEVVSDSSDDECVEVPTVGMKFSDVDEIDRMYRRYGKQQGFGISRAQSASNKEGDKRVYTWKCECWGSPRAREIREGKKCQREKTEIGGITEMEKYVKPRRRKSKKCGCEARIYACMNNEGFWVIKIVELEHKGHKPDPSDARLVKRYRMESFTSNLRRKVINAYEAGVPVNQIHASLARERDGVANMPFTAKDVRHVVDKNRKFKLEGGDAEALMRYLDRMRRDNKKFYYSIRVDVTGGLQDVMWVDARSKASYEEFGDVVCFDTTYMTNDYELPFANFVGVNHHGQTTLFGCALLAHEDIETFNWLFSQWLLCMDDKAPNALLTDQHPAMKRPIAELMPDTTHRYCIWHILSKVGEKLGGHSVFEEMKEQLLQAVYDSFHAHEFEVRWAKVMTKYHLTKNKWLSDLYDERDQWIPAFMRDTFWAGMRTTQRVESIHRFFDKYVKASTKLIEFGEKYIAAVESRMVDERDADERDKKWKRGTALGLGIERFFRDIYTDEKFMEVSRQIDRMTFCFVISEEIVDDEKVEMLLEDCIWVFRQGCRTDFRIDDKIRYRMVFNPKTKEALCECRMFQTHGILCRHIFRIYFQKGINEPPDCYVLHRWKKNVPRRQSLVKVCYHDPNRTVLVKRLDKMQIKFDRLSDRACLTRRRSRVVMKGIDKLFEEVEQLDELDDKTASDIDKSGLSDNNEDDVAQATQMSQPEAGSANPVSTPLGEASRTVALNHWSSNSNVIQTLRDPPKRKKRGRPRGSRWKSEAEKAMEKSPSSAKKKKQRRNGDESPERSSQYTDQAPESGTPRTPKHKGKTSKTNKGADRMKTVCETPNTTDECYSERLVDVPGSVTATPSVEPLRQRRVTYADDDAQGDYSVPISTRTKTRSVRRSRKLDLTDESSSSGTF